MPEEYYIAIPALRSVDVGGTSEISSRSSIELHRDGDGGKTVVMGQNWR